MWRSSPIRRRVRVNSKLLTVVLFAFGFASGAAAAISDPIIVCSGGVYCEDVRQECLAAGHPQNLCDAQWRGCVFDACPQ